MNENYDGPFPFDIENRWNRIIWGLGTLAVGWYLGKVLIPVHGELRQVVVTLAFWGVLYLICAFVSFSEKLEAERRHHACTRDAATYYKDCYELELAANAARQVTHNSVKPADKNDLASGPTIF